MKPTFSLCVYCGSRTGDSPAYAQAAQAVGTWIGQHQGQLIYGGGNNGLMGVVAQATAQAGGRVVGVIPQALVDKEVARRECDELHVVQTMHERKQMMAERADAFLGSVALATDERGLGGNECQFIKLDVFSLPMHKTGRQKTARYRLSAEADLCESCASTRCRPRRIWRRKMT